MIYTVHAQLINPLKVGRVPRTVASSLEVVWPYCIVITINHTYSGTGLESKLRVRATIGLFECIGEPNFRSPFAYVCSKPGVSFNTSMWMDHTNFQKLEAFKGTNLC